MQPYRLCAVASHFSVILLAVWQSASAEHEAVADLRFLSKVGAHRVVRQELQDLRKSDVHDAYCSVSQKDGGVGLPVHVFIQDGFRYVQFGDEAAVEGSAFCQPSKEPCPPCANSFIQVADVSTCPECPCELKLKERLQKSQTEMVELAEAKCKAAMGQNRHLDVLIIGLGVGMTHTNLWGACPRGSVRIRSVELDERMKEVSNRYFGLSLVEGESEVTVASASEFVHSQAAHENGTKYDIIFSDAFEGYGKTPDSLLTETFLQDSKSLLKKGGTFVHHIWHENPQLPQVALDYKAILPKYENIFGAANMRTRQIPRDSNAFDGFIYAELPEARRDAL